MNKVGEWFTKKRMFLFSFLFFIVNMVSMFSVDIGICFNYASKCYYTSDLIVSFTYIFISVFIFSVITYKLKDSTFTTWRNFSIWMVPISLIIIAFLPTRTHGMDFIPITKGTVIFLLTILYTLISLILIIFKSLKKDSASTVKGADM